MDAKITKKRLASMLSYDWLKIIGVALAIIFFWVLLLTVTSTKITSTQEFIVYNYQSNNKLDENYYKHLEKSVKDKTFSYEVITWETFDLKADGNYAFSRLTSYLKSDMGDVIFIPHVIDESTRYTDVNGKDAYWTHTQRFLNGYASVLYNFSTDDSQNEGLFDEIAGYLNRYYNGNYQTGSLDKEKIEKDFVSRIKRTKDKRFKTAEQIAQGKIDEVARIEKCRNALVKMQEYLTEGIIELTPLTNAKNDGKAVEVVYEGKYALNLCPSGNKDKAYYASYAEKLKDIVSYKGKAEEGKTPPDTAEDMCVMLFRFDSIETGLGYEGLLYVQYLIESCLH